VLNGEAERLGGAIGVVQRCRAHAQRCIEPDSAEETCWPRDEKWPAAGVVTTKILRGWGYAQVMIGQRAKRKRGQA